MTDIPPDEQNHQPSEDEKTENGIRKAENGSEVSVRELEDEVADLERQLKLEREEKKRLKLEFENELEREMRFAEDNWMEKTRQAFQERDALAQKTQHMEEQLDSIRIDVNRAVAYRLEMEESRNRIKVQLDNVQRDYEETMHERSTVLEENQRLSEERDNLKHNVRELNIMVDEVNSSRNETEIMEMRTKLEQTRRLLQLNMEETANANLRRTEATEMLAKARDQIDHLSNEKDDLGKRLKELELQREPIVDIWNTHTVEIALSYPKPNLGIVLSGGRTDDRYSIHSPIFVKEVLIGSPLENMLKRLDHIMIVNDIDVSEMDQRSVIDILKNSHHLKMVIRRRDNAQKIHEVTIGTNHELGVELVNGVFVNHIDRMGSAVRAGIETGARVVHVNHVPVCDAKHAEQLIKYSNTSVVLGILDGKKRPDKYEKDVSNLKQRTIFSKWFGRHNSDKPVVGNVLAKATIGNSCPSESSFYRQGSLRIPNTPQSSELVRYGSLRAPAGSAENTRISEHLDHILNKKRLSTMSEAGGSTWPKMVPEDSTVIPKRRLPRPSVFPVFNNGVNNSPASSRCDGCSSAASIPWSPRYNRSEKRLTPSIDDRAVTPSISNHMGHRNNRMSCNSPLLPHPPPYPGPRDDSLSSIISSNNSIPLASGSNLNMTYTSYASPSGTLLSESSDKIRRVHLSKEGSIGLENYNGGVIISNVQGRINGIIKKGDRLLDVGGINMRSADKESASKVLSQFGASEDEVTLLVSAQLAPRRIEVLRKNIRLCGGNAIGILAEEGTAELQEGDLILEMDKYNIRGATLEEATEVLLESLSEICELIVEEGGDRLNRLRLGADGDSFYVRINVDRNSENKDELDIKAGEIVFVDKTMFMGQRGRWRAWKVDREGRQRENGIIPSASHMERLEQKVKKSKNRLPLGRSVYERMERVCSTRKRPIIIFGALVTPFIQTLLDEFNKFSQVMGECRAMSSIEVERMLHTCEFINAKRRDKLFDVITIAAIQNIMDQGFHCILDVPPSAIQRLHSNRIHPIVIRIKFKSAKQIRSIKEDFDGEKLSSKQAKELMDKAQQAESEVEGLGSVPITVIQVNSPGTTRNIIKHICQQISLVVESEQKKTIWVTTQ